MTDGLKKLETVLETGVQTTAPALALAVYFEGKSVFNKAYGVLDPENQHNLTQPDTLFDLASVTKLYTTTAFLMQIAEGKVQLDTRVVEVLPEFGGDPRPIGQIQDPHTLQLIDAENVDLSLSPIDPNTITFRHLLTHTSGLPPWRDLFLHTGPLPPPPGIIDTVSHAQRLQQALALIAGYPFADAPGRTVRYSDLGLILLGAAVARLDSAASLAHVLQRRILQPQGLTRTGYNPRDPMQCAATELDTRWRNRRCQGEVHDENACGLGGIAGHAGLFGTADEVARFGQWWLDSLSGSGGLRRDIAQDAVALHAVTGVERRGLGWVLRTPGVSSCGQHFSDLSFGHTGFTGTSLWIDPLRLVVVALMTNRVYHGRNPDAIMALRPQVHDAVMEWLL